MRDDGDEWRRDITCAAGDIERTRGHCYNRSVPHVFGNEPFHSVGIQNSQGEGNNPRGPRWLSGFRHVAR